MHECEAIIAHCFGDCLVLCIIVNIGKTKSIKLTLALKKATPTDKMPSRSTNIIQGTMLS